jgi:hypothetical protein
MPVASIGPSSYGFSGSYGSSTGGVLADLAKDLKNSGDRVQKVCVNAPLEYARRELSRISTEQVEVLQSALSASHRLGQFSVASFIASALYAISLIAGGYYVKKDRSSQAEGDQFIRLGCLTLLNTMMSYYNGWDLFSRPLSFGNKTVEQGLSMLLPLGASTWVHLQTYQNLSSIQVRNPIMENIDKVFRIVRVFLELGQIYLKIQQILAEGKLTYLDTLMRALDLQVSRLTTKAEQVKGTFNAIESDLRGSAKKWSYTTADFTKIN